MSSIQQALRKAQRERETKEGQFSYLLGLFSSRPAPQEGRFNPRWLIGVGLVLLAAAALIVYGQRRTAEMGPIAQKPAQKAMPRPEPQTAHAPVAQTAKRKLPYTLAKPKAHSRISKARSHTEKAAFNGTAQPSAPATPSPENTDRLTASKRASASKIVSRPAMLEEAKRLREAGDTRGAAAVLEEFIEREPRRVDAIVALANLYLGDLEEPAKALSLYLRALALDRERASSHVNLGVYYLRMGEPAKAREHIERALNLDPNLPEAHYNMACLYATEGDPLGAQRSLDRAVELDSRCAQWAQEDPDLLPLRKVTQEPE